MLKKPASSELSNEQRAVLNDNMRAVLDTGLFDVYALDLRSRASKLNYAATSMELFGDGNGADKQRRLAQAAINASTAELPFGFGFSPSNMARSVDMFRVDPNTGERIAGSDVQLGLTDDMAGSGRPRLMAGFNAGQLEKAIEQIKKQEEVGLDYWPYRS